MRKRWVLTSLFAVIFLPVLAIIAILLFLSTADLTQHRDFIADNISKIAGRGLSLNGELELNISSISSIVVTDIVLANAAWASTPEMLSIHRIEASIELPSLLRGDIHIPRFHLQGVKALMETNSSGLSNWILAEPTDDVAVADDSVTTGEMKLPWIGDVSIVDVEFTYRDGQTGREILTKLDHARLGADTLISPTLIDIAGQVNEKPFEINGKLVLPSVFSADRVDVPIVLQVKALGLTAKAHGNITGAVQAPAVNLALHAHAADLEQLRQVFGAAVPQVKPVELIMEVQGDQGQPVIFKLNASAGKAKLATELTLQRQEPVPNISGKVELQDIDLVTLWAPLFNDKPGETSVKKTNAALQISAKQSDQIIPLDWLQAFDANVMLTAKRINLPQAKIKSLQSRFIVADRSLKIDQLKLVTDAGSVSADLFLDARGKQPTVRLELDTTSVALSRLAPLSTNKRFTDSQAEAAISLRAKGENIAGLIKSLQGSVKLDYGNLKRKEELSINLTREAKNKTTGKPQLIMIADGRIDGHAIELRGNITPLTGFLASKKSYQVDLRLQAFGVSSKIMGKVADLYTFNGLDLSIEAHAADMAGLRQAFGEAVPAPGKVDLSAFLTSEKSKIHISKLAILLDEGRIDGELTLDTAKLIPDLQADLSLTDLNIDKLLPAEKKAAKVKTGKAKAATIPAKEKLFSAEPLPFDNLSRANVRMTLRATNLLRNNETLKEAEIKINLQKGKLSASLLKHSAFHGELDNNIVIDTSGKGAPTVMIKFKAPRLELSELLTVGDGSAAVEGPLAIDISLLGQGSSLAQIMGSLNGNVYLLMEKGSANAKAIDMLVGGVTAMVGTMFAEQSSKTQINCAICDLKFTNGILKPQLIVLDTQYSTVFADGQVDLKKEQMDIKVSPQAKGVTLSVAYPVRLHGRLNKPGIEIEKTDAILKTGELWANIVYPPSALIKFSDLSGGRQNPCVSMVAEKAGIPILSDVGKAVGGVIKGVGGVVEGTVKGIGSGIGGIFDTGEQEEESKTSNEIVIDDDDFDMDY